MGQAVKILLIFSIATLLIWCSCKKTGDITNNTSTKNDTLTSVNPDTVVAGSYRVSIVNSGSYPPGVTPPPSDTNTYYSTVLITVASPGVISFTEDSITHLQTSYSFDSADSHTLQSYIYGLYPLSYAKFSHNGDTLYSIYSFTAASGGGWRTYYFGAKLH